MTRRGLSTIVGVVAAAVVAVLIASLAMAVYLQRSRAVEAGVSEEAGAVQREVQVRLSLVYHIGDEIMISNDGAIPVTVTKIIADNREIPVSATIDPGKKQTFRDSRLSGAKSIALVLSGGGIVVVKGP